MTTTMSDFPSGPCDGDCLTLNGSQVYSFCARTISADTGNTYAPKDGTSGCQSRYATSPQLSLSSRRRQQDNHLFGAATDRMLPRYMRQTFVSLQKAWLSQRILPKAAPPHGSNREDVFCFTEENEKRLKALDWNGNYTTNDLNLNSSNLVLRNTFPPQTLLPTTIAATQRRGTVRSHLNGGRELAIRSNDDDDDEAFEIHSSSVKRQSVVRSTSAVNRRPQTANHHRLAVSTHDVHTQMNGYELPSLTGGVPSISGTTFQLQERRKIREKIMLQVPVVGGRSSDSHLQPKTTPGQHIRSAESSVNCRRRRQHSEERLSSCHKEDAADNRTHKLGSVDQTSAADASRMFPANFLRLRENARLANKQQPRSAQIIMSRCGDKPIDQPPKNAPLQRPRTTTTSLTPAASRSRKAFGSPTLPNRRQSTIRKVVRSFVDHAGRKEKGININDLRKSCKKSKIPSDDVDAFRAEEEGLVPSIAVPSGSAENVAIAAANFSVRGRRSKSSLVPRNDDNSRSSVRLGGARSAAREKSVLLGTANRENDGRSGANSKKSSFPAPKGCSRKLGIGILHPAKSPTIHYSVYTTAKEVTPAKHCDDTSQDDCTVDDGQKELIPDYTIHELMEAAVKAEDSGEESRLRNERIVKWLLGLSYEQTERPPTPEETQNDTAIHVVYDGD